MRSTDENGDVSMEDLTGMSEESSDCAGRSHKRVPSSITIEERVKMVEIGMEVEEIERYR
jgi:hypothetical protein